MSNKEDNRRKKGANVGKKDINRVDYDNVKQLQLAKLNEIEINSQDPIKEELIDINQLGTLPAEDISEKFLNLNHDTICLYQQDYDKVVPLNEINFTQVTKINGTEINQIDISKEDLIVIDISGNKPALSETDLTQDRITCLPLNEIKGQTRDINFTEKNIAQTQNQNQNEINRDDFTNSNLIQENSDIDLDEVFVTEKRRRQSSSISPGYCTDAKNFSKFDISLIADNLRHSSIEIASYSILKDISNARFHKRSENMDEEMDYKNHEIINLKTTITSIESKMQSDRERKLRLEEDIVEYDNRHLKLLDDFKNLQLDHEKIKKSVIVSNEIIKNLEQAVVDADNMNESLQKSILLLENDRDLKLGLLENNMLFKSDILVGFFQSNGPANGMSCYEDKDGNRFILTVNGRSYY